MHEHDHGLTGILLVSLFTFATDIQTLIDTHRNNDALSYYLEIHNPLVFEKKADPMSRFTLIIRLTDKRKFNPW